MKQGAIDTGLISDRLSLESSRLAGGGGGALDKAPIQAWARADDDISCLNTTSGFVVDANSIRLRDLLTKLPGGRQLREWNKARRQRRHEAREAHREGQG